ncbi:hypothetical protein ANMWB30_24810 [Arthrobacter sp. MWB30]|nr:hypothetical protein ANMWB30_24810 [Arthrobacter sp. MWB30]
MTTIIPERLQELNSITLDGGSYEDFESGHSAMEVVAYLAGEEHTQVPKCASLLLRDFTVNLNDNLDNDDRQRLVPFLPRIVGTANDNKDIARSYLALDWLIRTYTPTLLDFANLTEEAQALRDLHQVVDIASAEAAGPVVRAGTEAADATQNTVGNAAGHATFTVGRFAYWPANGAWGATWFAARSRPTAWPNAGHAAAAAAGAAARHAVRAAAGAAVWDHAWSASMGAAKDAAMAALTPTVEMLKNSALELLDTMINPSTMSEYEVTYEFTMEQVVSVQANSKAEAIAKAKRGEYEHEAVDCNRTSAPSRKWRATKL